jgi:hypothetical protein
MLLYIAIDTLVCSLTGHLDFSVPDEELLNTSPKCNAALLGEDRALPHFGDRWSSVMASLKQLYKPEIGLIEVLRDFDGLSVASLELDASAVDTMGFRISLALKKVQM